MQFGLPRFSNSDYKVYHETNRIDLAKPDVLKYLDLSVRTEVAIRNNVKHALIKLKGMLAEHIQKYNNERGENISDKYGYYVEFLNKQMRIFTDTKIFSFILNKSVFGLEIDIYNDPVTIPLSLSVPVIKTQKGDEAIDFVFINYFNILKTTKINSTFIPLLKLTSDNYREVIQKVSPDSILNELLISTLESMKDRDRDRAISRIKDDIFETIFEYKIHLQFKSVYQIWVLEILNLMIVKYRDFRNSIVTIKTHNIYDLVEDKNVRAPCLVIYTGPNNERGVPSLIQKKNSAQTALNYIVDAFKDYSNEIGLDITPRYNHRYDKLIYWANGGGDTKNYMDGQGIIGEYFDETKTPSCDTYFCNYAHFKSSVNDFDAHIEPQPRM